MFIVHWKQDYFNKCFEVLKLLWDVQKNGIV